ncbi:DUF4401 domain-containing protein [Sphingobacterium tabacisoli]|uniref:DUF4401 domain-containing protein n=1 Tax=Sphingobacterium tabacisoli TaxID=2044855 RepID=A0ABW5L6I1_9SPHI|nr:DUF4401 domain-containing protein [Sphingobacterium tabacisoli]
MTPDNTIQQTASYLQSLDPELNLEAFHMEQSAEVHQVRQTLAIKILSIFGGILSSSAFWGFLVGIGLYRSHVALAVLGILAITIGMIIGKKFKQILWDTISVATFSIGFIMLGSGLFEFNIDNQYVSLCLAALSLLCLYLNPSYIISFISTLILNGSILSYIQSTGQNDFLHIQVSLLAIVLSYMFLKEPKLLHKSFKTGFSFHAIRTGLLLCFIIGLLLLRQNLFFFHLSALWSWSTSAVCTLIILYLSSKLLSDFGVSDRITRLATYALTLLVVAPTILYPGIVGSLLLILLCFSVRYRTGFVMGIIALLWFIGKFYYDLHYTLLTKSIMLFGSGLVFLLFYLFISKRANYEKI